MEGGSNEGIHRRIRQQMTTIKTWASFEGRQRKTYECLSCLVILNTLGSCLITKSIHVRRRFDPSRFLQPRRDLGSAETAGDTNCDPLGVLSLGRLRDRAPCLPPRGQHRAATPKLNENPAPAGHVRQCLIQEFLLWGPVPVPAGGHRSRVRARNSEWVGGWVGG